MIVELLVNGFVPSEVFQAYQQSIPSIQYDGELTTIEFKTIDELMSIINELGGNVAFRTSLASELPGLPKHKYPRMLVLDDDFI